MALIDDNLIELPEAWAARARQWAEAIYAKGCGNTPGVNVRGDSYFYGYVGEQGTRLWLRRYDKWHRHRVRLTGKSELSEFIVSRKYISQLLEVKTSTDPVRHVRFMASEDQPLHGDLFLGARVEQRTPLYAVRIMGWLWRSEVEALPIDDFGTGPVRWKFYKQMHPTDELRDMLDPVLDIVEA